MTPATNPAPTDGQVDGIVDELRDDVSRHLTELGTLLDLVQALIVGRQRDLGFLTPDGRRALDELIRDERAAQRGQAHDGIGADVGLKWLNRDITASGIGEIPAPVRMSAASFEAYAWATLQHLVTRSTRQLLRDDPSVDLARGWCTYPRPVRDIHLHRDQAGAIVWPGAGQLVAHLRILCWDLARPQLLSEIVRELEHLISQAEAVVDGAGRTHLGECPHCHRDTLVVHFRDRDEHGNRLGEFVRCGKDPTTGHHEPCTCTDDWCPCKHTPVTYRHTWWRTTRDAPDPRVAHDWHDLAGRLNIRRMTKEPTP